MSSGVRLGEIGLIKSGSWSFVVSSDRLEEVVGVSEISAVLDAKLVARFWSISDAQVTS